jgi:DNA-binding transcriptional LysR family regulator
MSFKRNLPSIKALVTFEAAMRLKSFTAAARELNVTQAAVSRQVRVLEEHFGVPLFLRGHRRVEPTSEGAMLGLTLSQSLDTIAETVESLRQFQEPRNLTVGATLAFSYFWLLPRLARFRELHPEVKIRVISQDEGFDLRSGNLDVVLRYGAGAFRDGRAVYSRTDRFFPVCSPAFASKLGRDRSPADLLKVPLIGQDAPDPTWMTWPDWFERVGLGRRSPPPALQFNHYTDAIAAALAGQGVALGWETILHDLIAARQLTPVGEKVQADIPYNIIVPLKRSNPAAETFAAWLGVMLRDSAAPGTDA